MDSMFLGGRLAAKAAADIWSVMGAVAEKPAPSELLSRKAISAIQGGTSWAQHGPAPRERRGRTIGGW